LRAPRWPAVLLNPRNHNRKWFGFALMGNGEPEILFLPKSLRLIARYVLERRVQAMKLMRPQRPVWLKKAIFKCQQIKQKRKVEN
jgi:hypothetical protein